MSKPVKMTFLVILAAIGILAVYVSIRLRALRRQYMADDEDDGRRYYNAIRKYSIFGVLLLLMLVIMTVYLLMIYNI